MGVARKGPIESAIKIEFCMRKNPGPLEKFLATTLPLTEEHLI